MKNKSFFSAFIFIIIAGIGLLWAGYVYDPLNILPSAVIAIVSVFAALKVSSAIRIADPWDKAATAFKAFSFTNGSRIIFHCTGHWYNTP